MAVRSCRACGLELRAGAKFCDACGASVGSPSEQASAARSSTLIVSILVLPLIT
jgi:uncharacterized membrane protein YvbJ